MTQSQTNDVPAVNEDRDALLITLSSGVVLRRTQPAAWALTEVERQMAPQKPKPPMVDNPDRGRAEPNEADPDYQQELSDFYTLLTERRYQVVIATGTRVESVPEGVPGPESDEWVEMLAALGLPCPPNMGKTERYLRWVKYVAAPSNEDWSALYAPVLRQIGTPEEDVAAATEIFRRDPDGRTDSDRSGA